MTEPSTLADDFEATAAAHRRRTGARCTVCAWLDSLDTTHPDIAPRVHRTIRDKDGYTVAGILAAIAKHGLPPIAIEDPDQALKRHRAKDHERRYAA